MTKESFMVLKKAIAGGVEVDIRPMQPNFYKYFNEYREMIKYYASGMMTQEECKAEEQKLFAECIGEFDE